MAIKLVSINIEGHAHLDLVIPFIKQHQPDIVNLQEVFAVDMPVLEQELGMKGQFAPMADVVRADIHQSHALGAWGIAQFTKLTIKDQQQRYYVRQPADLPEFMGGNDPNSMHRALIWSVVEQDGQPYTIATTHFTWSPKGELTSLQEENYEALVRELAQLPEFVVSGDFNSPRNGEPNNVFNRLAQSYKDNIPPEITTSIDGQFHKAGQLELMVDGLFSTPQYSLNNVQVVGGVSDHKAIVAEISRSA